MRTALLTVVAIVVVLTCILGSSALMTKVSAGREVARQHIAKATPDDVILQEIGIELRKATALNAEAQVEWDDLAHEKERCTRKKARLESDLATHREALKKERALLGTDQQEYIINGQRVSRQRLETDVLNRVRLCRDLENQIDAGRQEYAAYEQSLRTYQAQLDKSKAEYQAKAAELKQLQADLRTARVIEGLSTRLSAFSSLHENSNLARLTTEVRKRIGRSRASADSFSPAGSGLLDLSEGQGTSAEEAADRYLENLEQSNGASAIPEAPAQAIPAVPAEPETARDLKHHG